MEYMQLYNCRYQPISTTISNIHTDLTISCVNVLSDFHVLIFMLNEQRNQISTDVYLLI